MTTMTKKKNIRKALGALDPAVSPPPPLGVQIHYGHSRYVPKWFKVLKLVIFLMFDVCAVIPPPPTSSLHLSPCGIMDPL